MSEERKTDDMEITVGWGSTERVILDLTPIREIEAQNVRMQVRVSEMVSEVERLEKLGRANTELVAEANALRRQTSQLEAELAEARKQPVALLPEITSGIADEMHKDWLAASCRQSKADIYNIVLARHFRESAEARVKPSLDVEVIGQAISNAYSDNAAYGATISDVAAAVLRRYFTDAPAQPLQNTQQLPDETLAAAVARVERETRAKCAAMVRSFALGWYSQSELADRMERGE